MIHSWWDVGLFAAALVVAYGTITAFYKLDPRTFGERAIYFIGFTVVLVFSILVGYRLQANGVHSAVREWLILLFLSGVVYASILSKDE